MPSYKTEYRWGIFGRTRDKLYEWPVGFQWRDKIDITFWWGDRALRYYSGWAKYPPKEEPRWNPWGDLWNWLCKV